MQIKKMVVAMFAITIMSCMLVGCGFHLRHSQTHLETKYPTIVLPPSGSNTLHQALYRALVASSVHVQEKKEDNLPVLLVVSQQLTQQPLVYGPDAELRRERLRMSVVFSFSEKSAEKFELATERDRQLNSKQHLGDNAEKVIIEQEMQSDIVSQLIRYLASKAV